MSGKDRTLNCANSPSALFSCGSTVGGSAAQPTSGSPAGLGADWSSCPRRTKGGGKGAELLAGPVPTQTQSPP